MYTPNPAFRNQREALARGVGITEINPMTQELAARAREFAASAREGFSFPPESRSPDAASAGQPGQEAPLADRLAAYGFGDNVPRTLINTESGGNWAAKNNETGSGGAKGHFGILQFGQARMQDGIRAGVLPAGITPEQFMASPEMQVAMSNWHFNDIDNRIKANGLDRYVGSTIGNVPISMDGLRAMAHLGGFGGMSRFLSSGGTFNPADAYGTSLADYGRVHGAASFIPRQS